MSGILNYQYLKQQNCSLNATTIHMYSNEAELISLLNFYLHTV